MPGKSFGNSLLPQTWEEKSWRRLSKLRLVMSHVAFPCGHTDAAGGDVPFSIKTLPHKRRAHGLGIRLGVLRNAD